MKPRNKGKSSLFIMELVIVILFFSISAAISMKLFATAKDLSDYSETLNQSVLLSQSAAEAYKGSVSTGQTLESVTKVIGGTVQGSTIVIFYDDEWNEVSENQSHYYLVLRESMGMKADITVFRREEKNDTEVFSLNTKAIVREFPQGKLN